MPTGRSEEHLDAEALAVLLTRQVLHDPSALFHIYHAALRKRPIVPICLVGRGYDHKDAATHLHALEENLSDAALKQLRGMLTRLNATLEAEHDAARGNKKAPKELQAVQDELTGAFVPKTIGMLQEMLAATIPLIIAVNWEPEAGANQLSATVSSVLARREQKERKVPALKLRRRSAASLGALEEGMLSPQLSPARSTKRHGHQSQSHCAPGSPPVHSARAALCVLTLMRMMMLMRALAGAAAPLARRRAPPRPTPPETLPSSRPPHRCPPPSQTAAPPR